MIPSLFVMGIITTLAAEFTIFFLGAITIAVVKAVREKHEDAIKNSGKIPEIEA